MDKIKLLFLPPFHWEGLRRSNPFVLVLDVNFENLEPDFEEKFDFEGNVF